MSSNGQPTETGDEDTEVFTAKEAAKFARVGLKAFRDWGLPFIENGRRHLFLRSDILQYLREQRKVPFGWNDAETGGKG